MTDKEKNIQTRLEGLRKERQELQKFIDTPSALMVTDGKENYVLSGVYLPMSVAAILHHYRWRMEIEIEEVENLLTVFKK